MSLYDKIQSLKIISTHEHLQYEYEAIEKAQNKAQDILNLFLVHYTLADFISAGATEDDISIIQDTQISFDKRHAIFKKYLHQSRNTTQVRTLCDGLKELYKGNIFIKEEAEKMNKIRQDMHTEGVYREVLQNKGNIELLIRDCGHFFKEKQYFRTAIRMENWLGVSNRAQLSVLEKNHSFSAHSYDSFEQAAKKDFLRLIDQGAVAFKNAILYQRNPLPRRVSKDQAIKQYNLILSSKNAYWINSGNQWNKEFTDFQDYLMRQICSWCMETNTPIQIHTGMPEGNQLEVDLGNPTKFTELISDFPNVNFHLLHLGHPFEREASAMGKIFPNVYIDCSWLHQLNQAASIYYLDYLLDEVPISKILGFGGDYGHMEGVFSHLKIALKNIEIVFSNRIKVGKCTEEEALSQIEDILYNNPKRLLLRK